jgi:hypothetical protein
MEEKPNNISDIGITICASPISTSWVDTNVNSILSKKTLLDSIFFGSKREATLAYIGDEKRFSFERTNIVDTSSPRYKYVEQIVFRPDNNRERILGIQDIIKTLLSCDLDSISQLLQQFELHISNMQASRSKYSYWEKYQIQENIEEGLQNFVASLEAIFLNIKGIQHGFYTLQEQTLFADIPNILDSHITNLFPLDVIRLDRDNPTGCFSYLDSLWPIIEELAKFGAILTMLDTIREYNMKQVLFDDSYCWYGDWVSIFGNKSQWHTEVAAKSFPDIPLILLRAPNGSGKTYAQERDMAIQVLAQSIGYVPAKIPKMRIYDIIWMQSRLRSVQATDIDLSALVIEWRSLDELFATLNNNPHKKALVYLDETGATTDENSEYAMMTRFLDSVRSVSPATRIRFSTHNQLLIDAMRQRQDENIGIYTFSHDHLLSEWERGSDTINSLKHLIDSWSVILEKGFSGEDSWNLDLRDLEPLLKKLTGFQYIYSGDLSQKKSSIQPKWDEFKSFVEGIILELESVMQGTIEIWGISVLSQQWQGLPISFSPEQKTLLATRSKWLRGGIFPSTNQRWDYQIATVKHSSWKNPRKTMIGRTWKSDFHFYEDSNMGDWDDCFETSRIPRETEYRKAPIGYTGTDWYSGISRTSKIQVDRDGLLWGESGSRMIYEVFNHTAGLNIPLTQEKRDLLHELQDKSDQVRELCMHSEFLRDLIHAFIFFRQKMDADFLNTKFPWEKPLLKWILESLTITPQWHFRDQTECIEFLENIHYDKGDLNLLKRHTEDIITLYLLAGWSRDAVSHIFWSIQELDAEVNKDSRKCGFAQNTLNIFRSITKELHTLLLESIPQVLVTNGDMNLSDIFEQDFSDSLIEVDGVDREKQYIWIRTIRFIQKYRKDTTKYLEAFLSILDSFDSPLLKGMARYYRDILGFALGKVENIETLGAYYRRYRDELWPAWYVPFSTLVRWKKTQDQHDYHDTRTYVEDPAIPNMTGNESHWHMGIDAVSYDVGEFIGILWLSDFLRQNLFAPVRFEQGKVFFIEDMWSPDLHAEKPYVRNSIHLTQEHPIEIIEGCNSSWKTRYIRDILKTINQALNIWYVNAKDMTLGNIENYAYIDRVVSTDNQSWLSSWQKDILSWIHLLKVAEEKDFVIVEADEIFSTMDAQYTALFARVFVGRLRAMWKFAIIVTHNHDFARIFGELPGVQHNHFHSELLEDGTVQHTYKKQPGWISDSHWVAVLKSVGIWKDWL